MSNIVKACESEVFRSRQQVLQVKVLDDVFPHDFFRGLEEGRAAHTAAEQQIAPGDSQNGNVHAGSDILAGDHFTRLFVEDGDEVGKVAARRSPSSMVM